jgi:serine/threonine kinase 32
MEAADFVNKLLQRKPQNRLGLNGANEVKNHIWLRDYDW